MEISARGLWTLLHGMGFGGLFLLAGSGALVELYRICVPARAENTGAARGEGFLRAYLVTMAVLAWLAVLTGAYIIYPWYRAVPPTGVADLHGFPQRLLMANPQTIGWHALGMEWKEHVAWLAPIAVTMAAAVVWQYGRDLKRQRPLRAAMLCFLWVSLGAAGVAGFFGAMINKNAPVEGGVTIRLQRGK
jgi:hypothetical protein